MNVRRPPNQRWCAAFPSTSVPVKSARKPGTTSAVPRPCHRLRSRTYSAPVYATPNSNDTSPISSDLSLEPRPTLGGTMSPPNGGEVVLGRVNPPPLSNPPLSSAHWSPDPVGCVSPHVSANCSKSLPGSASS